jgi:hypothetical protein
MEQKTESSLSTYIYIYIVIVDVVGFVPGYEWSSGLTPGNGLPHIVTMWSHYDFDVDAGALRLRDSSVIFLV